MLFYGVTWLFPYASSESRLIKLSKATYQEVLIELVDGAKSEAALTNLIIEYIRK